MHGRLGLALVLAALVAGCDTVEPRLDSIQGKFDLVSTNGRPLPVVIKSGPGYELVFQSAMIEFDANGDYVGQQGHMQTGSAVRVDIVGPFGGRYKRSEDEVRFDEYEPGRPVSVGRISGNRLVVRSDTMVLVYRRQ